MRKKDTDKRIAIYEAVIKVVHAHGLSATSMSKISKESNLSSSTIYVYFKNKDDMLNSVYLMMVEEMNTILFTNFTKDIEIKKGYFVFMNNLFTYIKNNSQKFSVKQQLHNAPSIYAQTKKKALAFYAPFVEFFTRSVKEKVIKDYPINLMKIFIFESIQSLAQKHHAKELVVSKDVLDKTITMIWEAIKR